MCVSVRAIKLEKIKASASPRIKKTKVICISGAIPAINAESKDLKTQGVNSYRILNNPTLWLTRYLMDPGG